MKTASPSKRVDPSQTGGVRRRALAHARRRLRALRPHLIAWMGVYGPTANTAKSDKRAELEAMLIAALVEPDRPAPGATIRNIRMVRNEAQPQPEEESPLWKWSKRLAPLALLPWLAPAANTWLDAYTDGAFTDAMHRAYAALGGEAATGMTAQSWMAQAMREDNSTRLFDKGRDSINESLHGIANRTEDRAIQVALYSGTYDTDAKEVDAILGRAENELARTIGTAAVAAAAMGTLAAMADLGVSHVTAMVEFTTAGDDAVCDECADLEGQIFTLEEAEGVIPQHQGCRCSWNPTDAEIDAGETVSEE